MDNLNTKPGQETKTPEPRKLNLGNLTFKDALALSTEDSISYAENLREIVLKMDPLQAAQFLLQDLACNSSALIRSLTSALINCGLEPAYLSNESICEMVDCIMSVGEEQRKTMALYASISKITPAEIVREPEPRGANEDVK